MRVCLAGATGGVGRCLAAAILDRDGLVLRSAGRLKVAKGLREAEALQNELQAFQRRITESGNNAFEGVGEHDDLVIAVALACWWPTARKPSTIARSTAALAAVASASATSRTSSSWTTLTSRASKPARASSSRARAASRTSARRPPAGERHGYH